ncbi:hypothetical protein H634G_06073 [Metarhizium anisopliae BRIP 53293]|uniref:Uncharacterized protein n=1 Tax=Metarhizium anisopliae BRIP 53293 TaxID=1291518 RepID=A0A0D9NXI0_METAN|nr:hypothetical protein H634G_06073 [Metarhizium anisopliae BRIP 53293]KJK90786.1 hypothetical protein H633G_05416 [Metarhizium anisopliae BRIP 53284]
MSWLETAKQSLDESGFFELPDLEVGERISTFQSRNFPYGTVFALELLVEPVIFDPRTRDILNAYPEHFVLGHQVRYTAKPGRFFRFWAGAERTSRVFVVHQWAKGSRVDYWIGSHKVTLPVLRPRLDNQQRKVMEPLLENTKESLIDAGCKPREFHFPEGGLIITDARISFDRQAGYEFADVFFPHSLLPKLAMEVPYSPEMEKKTDVRTGASAEESGLSLCLLRQALFSQIFDLEKIL